MSNELTKRELIALQILNGSCAGDWKFELAKNVKWEDVAVSRAFEIADAFLAFGNVETVPEKKIKLVKKRSDKNEGNSNSN